MTSRDTSPTRSPRLEVTINTRTFLRTVWALQPTPPSPPRAFCSTKDWDTGTWTDHATDPADPTIPDNGDLYFSPHLFTDTRRTRRNSAPSGRWLYADLDEVNPKSLTPQPTLAWETSPGRYQAMWLLNKPIPRRRLEQLNQRMTYYTGADRGGWSLTKVLRVPGSVSHKRPTPHEVRLVMNTKTVHSVTDLTELLRDVDTTGTAASAGPAPAEADIPTYEDAMRRSRRKMTARARQLIRTEMILESDDRSARMWELETSLIRSSIRPLDVLAIVRHTAWNKWRGQRREITQLWSEITKAAAQVASSDDPPAKPKTKLVKGSLPNTLMYDDFMRMDWERPEWLIEGIWTAGAYGILAGEYKSFKTMMLLEIAVSVASGEPFLGKYKVVNPGLVSYVHEEGRHWSIHERLRSIASFKGLTDKQVGNDIHAGYRSLPIAITSLPRLNLITEHDQQALVKHVQTHRPKLVILETFYLMAGGVSESAIEEIAPFLEFLASISHTYGTAIILSHHFHKSREDGRTFDRVSGSNIFLRWYESAMFIERTGKDEDNTITVHSSHRDGEYTKNKLRLTWKEAEQDSFAIHHVTDEEEDPNAALVVDMAEHVRTKDTVAEWRASLTPADKIEYVRTLTGMTERRSLRGIAQELGIARTEYAASIAKELGMTVTTDDGVRYILPLPTSKRRSPKGGSRAAKEA